MMKKINIYYWIFSGLLAVLMTISAIPDMIMHPQAIETIKNHLGYPLYFLPFIGVAKLLGAVAILIPGFRRIKEWAYAGFVYDIIGAIYSSISVGDPVSSWAPPFIAIVLIFLSYFFYHKKLAASSQSNVR